MLKHHLVRDPNNFKKLSGFSNAPLCVQTIFEQNNFHKIHKYHQSAEKTGVRVLRVTYTHNKIDSSHFEKTRQKTIDVAAVYTTPTPKYIASIHQAEHAICCQDTVLVLFFTSVAHRSSKKSAKNFGIPSPHSGQLSLLNAAHAPNQHISFYLQRLSPVARSTITFQIL